MIRKMTCGGLLTVILLFLFRAMAMAQTITTPYQGSGTETDPFILPPATYGSLYDNIMVSTISGGGDDYSLLNFFPIPQGITLMNNISYELYGTPTQTGTFIITGTFNGTAPPYTYYQLTVSPALLTITPNNATTTYGTAPTLTASYNGFVYGDNASSLTKAPTFTTTATTSSPVGSYSITASGAVDANYTISYGSPGTLTILPASLSITANDTLTYGGPMPPLALRYTGFVNGDTASSLTTQATVRTTATAASPVGNYPITISGAADSNYLISYVSGTLTIEKADLTITANPASSTYGAALAPDASLSVSYSGFANGDRASSLTTAPAVANAAYAGAPARTYSLTPSGAADPNYNIQYVSGTYTIKPATLTVTAGNDTMTYGGIVPALNVTYSGFVNGDNTSNLTTPATATTTATSASAAGTYPITAAGAADTNYSFVYVPGTLMINPASLNVVADSATKVYGTPDPTLQYTVSGLVNGDDTSIFTGSLSRDTGTNVGSYPITQGTLSAGSSYVIYFTGNVLTITKAPQQITWTQRLLFGCDTTTQFQLTATANSGLPVIYTTSNPAVATIAGDVLTLLQPGSVMITASQAGDSNYFAAADVTDTAIDQSPSLVRQHWGDVLFFDNSSDQYDQWQWYKNGTAIPGATGQYYSETPALNGQYYVIATENTGQQIQTCPLSITGGSGTVAGGIQVFPNPVGMGASATVVSNYSAAALQGALMQIVDMSGKVWQQITNIQPSMKVTMPTAAGIYTISLQLSNGQKATVNVLVIQ
jgi:hypothetical protein